MSKLKEKQNKNNNTIFFENKAKYKISNNFQELVLQKIFFMLCFCSLKISFEILYKIKGASKIGVK